MEFEVGIINFKILFLKAEKFQNFWFVSLILYTLKKQQNYRLLQSDSEPKVFLQKYFLQRLL